MKRANIFAAIASILITIAGYYLGGELIDSVESYHERATVAALEVLR